MNSPERQKWLKDTREIHVYKGKGFHGHVKIHSHAFYHCTLVLTGAITQQQAGQIYHLAPGMLFSTPPDTPHGLFIFDAYTSYYCVSYPENLIQHIFSSKENKKAALYRPSPSISLDPETNKALVSLLDLLSRIQDNGEALSVRHSIAETFIRIVAGSIHQTIQEKKDGDHHPSPPEIKECIRYIDEHYATIEGVSDLSDFSGLSKSLLYKLFYKETKTTVHQYLTEKRIHEAVRMIHLHSQSLSEIAQKVGYREFSTFYRNFIKVTNMSPSAYQKIIQGESVMNN